MLERLYDTREAAYRSIGETFSGVNEPEWNLIGAFNTGDHWAFEEVYKELYSQVFYFACGFVEKEEAEDITADAFCSLWRIDKNFASLQKIKTFLQVCVRNACISYLRKTKAHAEKNLEIARMLEGEEDGYGENDSYRALLLERITWEIEKLPPGARTVFKLSYFEDLNSREIASRLGIAEGTVRYQKKRALSLLREALRGVELYIMILLVSIYMNTCIYLF